MRLSPRLKQLVINLCVLACTLTFLIAAGEIFLRVSYIQPMSIRQIHIHRPSAIPGVVYEFIPSLHMKGFGPETITINSQGFRSPELDSSKPLVAVIGDSFTFGYGVNDDQTNPADLQKSFPSVSVLNTGVNGYNIEQEARVFKARIAQLHPALIIVEFVFNDMEPKGFFDENGFMRVGNSQDAKIQESIARPGLINFPGKYWMQKNSAIFNFLERTTKWLPFRKHDPNTAETITSSQLAFYKQWLTVLTNAAPTSKKLFVIWPESNLHTIARPALKKMALDKGYAVLDLYDVFGNTYQSLGWDDHPSSATQKKAADAMAAAIEKNHLLEE